MSLALKYSMKKRGKKACSGPGCTGCSSPQCMAEGGFVGEEEASGYADSPGVDEEAGEEGIVDRIMKRFAKGGEVQSEEPVADFEENDFSLDDAPKADDDGSNEIGDEAEDDDEKDIVSRIMKSRGKKDRMPRTA